MAEGKKDLQATVRVFKKSLEVAIHNPFFILKVTYLNGKYKMKKNINSILNRGYKALEDFKF